VGFTPHKLFQLFESGLAQQIQEGAGVRPRESPKRVNLVECARASDEHNFSTQLFKPARCASKSTLQG